MEIKGNLPVGLSLRWDAETDSERDIFLGDITPRFFTVPLDAEVGVHPVKLFSDGRLSEHTVHFEVTDGVIRDRPRLDDVTITGFGLNGRNASMILMAHGANIDAGATILINGEPQPTVFYRILRNTNLNARDPATLGYPIFHYATVWTFLIDWFTVRDVMVSVENLDGVVSNEILYDVPDSMAELDSDGDSLPDELEINGYDLEGDGMLEVDLAALGADPMRKDLFVEVDWMEEVAPNLDINPNVWQRIEEAFYNAPVLNSDGSQGVAIHIDRGPDTGGGGGQIIPFHERIVAECIASPDSDWISFYDFKDEFFDANRADIFRYAILAWRSGDKIRSISGNAPFNDGSIFYVTLGTHDDRLDSGVQIGTFMHELGHTLGLNHGGKDSIHSKDNYNSIMQYGNESIEIGGQFFTPSPNQKYGIDVNCNLDDFDRVYTYSQGQRRDLDERMLSEEQGMCDNISRDWNKDTFIGCDPDDMECEPGTPVMQNLDVKADLEVIQDYADWANLIFKILYYDVDPPGCENPLPRD